MSRIKVINPHQTKGDTMEMGTTPLFVKDVEAARLLGMGAQHLRNMRSEGKGPSYCRLGKWSVRYAVNDLIKWAERGRVETAA